MSQSQPLIRCAGAAALWDGDTLVARTERAMATDRVEANGDLLVPRADFGVDPAALADGAAVPDPRPGPDGAAMLRVDPARLRVMVEDRWTKGGGGTVNRFPRWGDLSDLTDMIDVRPAGEGRFVASTHGDIRRNVVEGGQLLAQSMVAASKSVPDKRVISAQIILSRPAVFDKPLDLQVDAHRAGRNFATLGVQATQDGKPVSSALILLDKGAPDLIRGQVAMPDVPAPEDCPEHDFGMTGREVRFVNGDYDPDPDRVGPPDLHCWVRHRDSPAELYLRQALLAQSTSHYTIAAAMLPHRGFGEAQAHVTLSTGVLTVSLALHEEPDLTDWLLYTNPSTWAGRGLAQGEGRLFTRDGRLVASFATQVMIRDFGDDRQAIGLDSTRIM